MNARLARQRVDAAQAQLELAHAALVRSARPRLAALRAHPVPWLIGGGLVGGFVTGFLPWRALARFGVFATSSSTMLLRMLFVSSANPSPASSTTEQPDDQSPDSGQP